MADPAAPMVIKRYPNRKLYDTHAKRYITLEEIEQQVRAGRDVRVLDHGTGEDITTLTLSNIILEKEKKQSGTLPKSLFTDLIQRGGRRVYDYARRVVGGWFGNAQDVETYLKKTLDDLVRAGKLGREQAEEVCGALVRNLGESRERFEQMINDRVDSVLRKLRLATGDDVRKITQALEQLEEKVSAVEGRVSTPQRSGARPSASGRGGRRRQVRSRKRGGERT